MRVMHSSFGRTEALLLPSERVREAGAAIAVVVAPAAVISCDKAHLAAPLVGSDAGSSLGAGAGVGIWTWGFSPYQYDQL
ncbi:hypothetical protein O1611_g8929 [Lasiodiplodia mahajangana]|uniref:Uncharacterized protein n=1 Tax=Lasiodiplodia mahajangana TaxID=1108764 RepID=A0ACC2JBB9_9PEZI|nr:hypothetical protein O1611_g8929 [Lasiodiplodia mahajangana]